ncbi:hypothetical protein BJY59DRAFT_23108 [Rhodotorula toruloides]
MSVFVAQVSSHLPLTRLLSFADQPRPFADQKRSLRSTNPCRPPRNDDCQRNYPSASLQAFSRGPSLACEGLRTLSLDRSAPAEHAEGRTRPTMVPETEGTE